MPDFQQQQAGIIYDRCGYFRTCSLARTFEVFHFGVQTSHSDFLHFFCLFSQVRRLYVSFGLNVSGEACEAVVESLVSATHDGGDTRTEGLPCGTQPEGAAALQNACTGAPSSWSRRHHLNSLDSAAGDVAVTCTSIRDGRFSEVH